MKQTFNLLLVFTMLILTNSLSATDITKVSVFYKDKKPSQQVLEKINLLLESYKDSYQITYYMIEEEKNKEIIAELVLPTTHLPFAIVIDGKYTANIDEKVVSFVHFPLFMKGIGRHEGNWSIADVEKVLNDNSLISEKNILPVLIEEESDSDCND